MNKLLSNKKKIFLSIIALFLTICLISGAILIGYNYYLNKYMFNLDYSIKDACVDSLENTNNYITYGSSNDMLLSKSTSSNICNGIVGVTEDCIMGYEQNTSGMSVVTSPITENQFKKAASEPLSTFSSDVDTASYVTFRQLVSYGYAKERMKDTTFRTEEFLNYFNYNYVSPKEGEMFGVTTEVGVCPWNSSNSLVRIGIKASELTKSDEKPLNLVFLIDASGSMCDNDKLPLLQSSFKKLLTKLDANDTISIVTYAGDSRIVAQGIKGNETKALTAAINSITAEGSTNGSAGIEEAYNLAKKYYKKTSNNRVILATDGDLNVGLTDTKDLGEFIAEKKDSGIYLSVLGFGSDFYNDSIMETLADKGNGNYSIIDSLKQANKVLIDEFNGTINTVATDVKFQVEFDKNIVSEYRLIGYENRQLENADFDNDAKDAGDVGAGQTLTILYEIIPTKNSVRTTTTGITSATNSIKQGMTLNIRYKNNYNSKSDKVSHPINCTPQSKLSDDFTFVSTIAELVMYLNDSTYAKTTDLSTLYNNLKDISLEDEEKAEFAMLIKNLGANMER